MDIFGCHWEQTISKVIDLIHQEHIPFTKVSHFINLELSLNFPVPMVLLLLNSIPLVYTDIQNGRGTLRKSNTSTKKNYNQRDTR